MNIKNRIFRASIINALIVSLVLEIFITSHAQEEFKFNMYNSITDEIGLETDTLLLYNTLPASGVINSIYNETNSIDEEDNISVSDTQINSMSDPIEINYIEKSIVEGNYIEEAITEDSYIEESIVVEDLVENLETEDIEIHEEIIENPQFIEVPEYYVYINAYSGLRARTTPTTDTKDNIITVLPYQTKIKIFAESFDGEWAVLNFENQIAYISKEYVQETLPEDDTYNHNWDGKVLNNSNGKVEGPSGIETYYNLPMSGCVKLMNHLGYYGTVWTRSDGAKMWDGYVMVAADLSTHPKGSLVETTLGTGIVVDTGDFVHNGSGVSLDIATAW